MDVVETSADAEGLTKPPLLVLDRVRAFLDEHGLGAGDVRARRIGEGGGSNFTFLLERDDGRFVLRRPPRPPLPPSAHDVVREARLQLALREAGFARLPTIVAVCDDEDGDRRPVLRHGRARRVRADGRAAARARRRACPPRARRRPRRRARRDPRGRRGDAGSRRVRTAGELQRAPGPPLRAALGDQQDARAPGGRRGRRTPRRRAAGPAALDRRARRLPAREHDGRSRRPEPHPRRPRLGDGRDRRPARRRGLPARDVQRAGRAAEPARHVAGDRARGLPVTADLVERYAARSGRDVEPLAWFEALALWKAAVFCEAIYGRFVRGELGAEDTRAARFEQGVPYLAEAAAAALDRG